MAEFAAHTSATIAEVHSGGIAHDAEFTIEQQITNDGVLVDHFHVTLAGGTAVVIDGPAPSPDLTIRQDERTARALRDGEIHAQRAFLTGQLEIDGDIDKLLENRALLTRLVQGRDA